jgi:hypothetical protein
VSGELLCFARNEARPPALQSPVASSLDGAQPGANMRLLIVPDRGFVRMLEIDWIHRRARIEIGIQGAFDGRTAEAFLELARECAFDHFNLHRVYGWVRSTHQQTLEVLRVAGFECEAIVPAALRVDGALVDRGIWGSVAPA